MKLSREVGSLLCWAPGQKSSSLLICENVKGLSLHSPQTSKTAGIESLNARYPMFVSTRSINFVRFLEPHCIAQRSRFVHSRLQMLEVENRRSSGRQKRVLRVCSTVLNNHDLGESVTSVKTDISRPKCFMMISAIREFALLKR